MDLRLKAFGLAQSPAHSHRDEWMTGIASLILAESAPSQEGPGPVNGCASFSLQVSRSSQNPTFLTAPQIHVHCRKEEGISTWYLSVRGPEGSSSGGLPSPSPFWRASRTAGTRICQAEEEEDGFSGQPGNSYHCCCQWGPRLFRLSVRGLKSRYFIMSPPEEEHWFLI